MNYEIITSDSFKRNFRVLSKKYHSLNTDLMDLVKELRQNPKLGDDLGGNIRKVRMAIASKNKGKRGGARIITYHLLLNKEQGKIYLLTIYDKGEQDTIPDKEIKKLKHESGLL